MNFTNICQKLQERGIEINEGHLEDARLLLIENQADANNPDIIVRVAVLRHKNPLWTDAQVIEQAVRTNQEYKAKKPGYGADINSVLENEILDALEQSGCFDAVAERVKAKSYDRIINRIVSGNNGDGINKRTNALFNANQNYQRLASSEDSIIDAEYTELDDLDAVISSLSPTPESIDFKALNPIKNKSDDNGDNSQKKLLNGAKNGEKN